MNQYYGSQLAGKRRLAALSAIERDAARAPQIGRSRAERLLDDSFGSLKRARVAQKADEVRFDPSDLLPKAAGVKTQVKPEKVHVKEETQAAHLQLLQLLRRLDLRPKFARTCDLLKRFFQSSAGAALLEDWREAILGNNVQAASDSHAWVVFYAAWRLAVNENVTSVGDARATIIYLFENVFKLKHEISRDLMQYTESGQDGDADTRTSTEKDVKVAQDSESLLLKPSVAELSQEGALRECSEARARVSLKEQRLKCGSGDRAFFDRANDWRTTYDRLMPVCRIPPLCHNMLYTDDAHIFHRALQALEQVYDTIPEGIAEVIPKIRPPQVPQSNVESDQLVWEIPTGVELRGWERDFLVSSLPVIFLCRTAPWARVATEQFFRKIYFGRQSKFSLLEQDQIEAWQKELTSDRRNVTADSARNTREAAIATPGAAHVPIRDVREEIINTSSGAATWAARQIT